MRELEAEGRKEFHDATVPEYDNHPNPAPRRGLSYVFDEDADAGALFDEVELVLDAKPVAERGRVVRVERAEPKRAHSRDRAEGGPRPESGRNGAEFFGDPGAKCVVQH